MKRLLSTGFLLFVFLLQPVKGQAPLPENFDEWVEDHMAQWEIPGMAIAVVKDDSIFYLTGVSG